MKFCYEYRTPDNAQHHGVVVAPSRDAAYAALKSQGIRPARLVEAPGFLNHLLGRGKRWLAIALLALVSLALALMALHYSHEAQTTKNEARLAEDVFDSPTRRYPIGDAAIIAEGLRTGWASVFPSEAERFLASHAIPGERPAVSTVSESSLRALLSSSSSPSSSSSLEARQLRAIVGGLISELRAYLADGGTPAQYIRRLAQRQQEEIAFRDRARAELETAVKRGASEDELLSLLRLHNDTLRPLGIHPLILRDFLPAPSPSAD